MNFVKSHQPLYKFLPGFWSSPEGGFSLRSPARKPSILSGHQPAGGFYPSTLSGGALYDLDVLLLIKDRSSRGQLHPPGSCRCPHSVGKVSAWPQGQRKSRVWPGNCCILSSLFSLVLHAFPPEMGSPVMAWKSGTRAC